MAAPLVNGEKCICQLCNCGYDQFLKVIRLDILTRPFFFYRRHRCPHHDTPLFNMGDEPCKLTEYGDSYIPKDVQPSLSMKPKEEAFASNAPFTDQTTHLSKTCDPSTLGAILQKNLSSSRLQAMGTAEVGQLPPCKRLRAIRRAIRRCYHPSH